MAEGRAPDGGLSPGDVIWALPEDVVGRERAGRRPALIVASAGYLATMASLALVVPITSVDRGWPSHVEVTGTQLDRRSWVMSEQVRTISRDRVVGRAGRADGVTLLAVRTWIADFLDVTALPAG